MSVEYSAPQLIQALRDARARTLELVAGLSGDQLVGPKLEMVNPLLWEIGHLAWFQERWVLRHLDRRRPLLFNTDELYDSMNVHHETRWDLPLPSLTGTLEYMQAVLEAVLARLSERGEHSSDAYFYTLVTNHEDMHAEAFTYSRQILAYPVPRFGLAEGSAAQVQEPEAGPLSGDVELPGGTFMLGAEPTDGFVFDNEKWAHPVEIAPYRIARAPVTNEEFTKFVEDGGYRNAAFWSSAGWRWRVGAALQHPVYWRRDRGGRWTSRFFDRMVPLAPYHPVMHVSWHEAQAYCRWAGRRLPSEAEWELAAAGGLAGAAKRRFPWGDEEPSPRCANLDARIMGCIDVGALPEGDSPFGLRQMIGNVWEWTDSDFLPFPGFKVDPYKDYSKPWFGSRKVLRGGCWVTRGRMLRNTWRNFFTPDRSDIYAGFRTCAL